MRVNSIKERPNETWEDWEKEQHTLFKENLAIEKEKVIERALRVKAGKSKKCNTQRTIVCRILNFKGKIKILWNAKKLKGKNIFINKDLFQAMLDHRE